MATTRQTKSTSSTKKSKETKRAAKPAAKAKTSPSKRAGSTAIAGVKKKPATRSKAPARSKALARSKSVAVVSPTTSGGVRSRGRTTVVSKDGPREVAARDLALAIANAALDMKAESVEVIDIRGRVDYADYLVVMSGRSDRHVVAVAQGIEHALKQQGHRCLGVEGMPQGQWVLMDFADVIAHVFHGERRGYYDLEGLWLDADRVPFASGATAAASAG